MFLRNGEVKYNNRETNKICLRGSGFVQSSQDQQNPEHQKTWESLVEG